MFFNVLTPLLFFCVIATEEDLETSELTDHNFSSRMKEHSIILVMFYIPLSDDYKIMDSECKKVSDILDRNTSTFALLKVNCSASESEETCLRFKVNGNIALKVFRHGKYSEDYKGPKTALEIAKFLKSHFDPPLTELKTTDCLNEFLDAENKTALVGLFKNDSEMKVAFFDIADKFRNRVRFAHTSATDIIEILDYQVDILMFRPLYFHNQYEPTILPYKGRADTSKIKQFIDNHSHGLVGKRDKENAEDFRHPLVVVYFNIDYENFPQTTQYWRSKILKVANNFQGNVTFAMSNAVDFDDELENCDLDFLDKPVAIARDGKTNKYVLGEEFSVHRLEKFVQDLLANKLKPYFLRSEPTPVSNDGSVKVAVAETFKAMVVDSAEDTLVGFHSKWCALCKKLSSGYEELAKKLKDEHISFVAMDAFNNDVPDEYKVEQLYTPTIYWAPIGSKYSPFRYRGKFEEESLIRFIAKYATFELKGYDRRGHPKTEVRTEL